jgi:hypothetical protein
MYFSIFFSEDSIDTPGVEKEIKDLETGSRAE